jgi:DNA segregation ATPase FtsK/SpoIIIE, S-DNA-T family
LVLIDPKRNAFNDLKGSAFLLNPSALVYPDEQPAERVLEKLADEMERRYKRLQEAGADTVDRLGYLARVSLPRILCICDEYFDLINRDRESRIKIEAQIFRLGAKARSAGIHLMIATQHPNRQTIKGTLDVNLPARVGLKVSKGIDATVLLNRKGAENLLGNGDLLFKNIGEPVRLQSPLLGIEERRHIFAPK